MGFVKIDGSAARKRYLCLRDVPIFSGLNRESFGIICASAAKQFKKKNEFLFHQGDAADAVYVIKEGNFKLLHTTEAGDEAILQIVGPGDLLGECALFHSGTFQPVSAMAMEDAKTCSIDRATFERVIRKEPELALQIIESLGSRLYSTWEQLTASNTQNSREKILSLFIRLAQAHGESCLQGLCIKIRLTQQEIASLVGISRVMASQVLNGLIKDDYIARKNGFYILKNNCF